jgi:hypothetical protein
LYAPHIPELGLDMTRKSSRDAVWRKEKSLPPPLMDLRTIFYPEMTGYAVCSISYGGRTLLQWENGYRVYGCAQGI